MPRSVDHRPRGFAQGGSSHGHPPEHREFASALWPPRRSGATGGCFEPPVNSKNTGERSPSPVATGTRRRLLQQLKTASTTKQKQPAHPMMTGWVE